MPQGVRVRVPHSAVDGKQPKMFGILKIQRFAVMAGKSDKRRENRRMEALEQMNEQEMKRVAIEKYVNIQRIKKHGQEEIEYQEKIARAELQMLGISTEDLEIKK